MRYGEALLEEILRRTDLVQSVGRRVKLGRRGRSFWGLCPFHKEKSPSFKSDNERRIYKCFGCGAGGDAFKWLMETEGLSFPEAVERLAGDAGVDLPKWSAQDEARETKKKSLSEIVDTACAFFEAQLRGPAGAGARTYLASRGLDDEGLRRFRLGYAPGAQRALIDHLQEKGVALEDMAAAGLARAAEDGKPARDFFFNRVMFPIADTKGRIVAFGARALEEAAKPKYINTGETALFSKGHLLYNFAAARTAALKAGTIVLAEGYMDVIALVRGGIEAAVAPLGTALTAEQLALLWRVAPEPVLAFDGDEAGVGAAHRAARLALAELKPGFSLRFAFLPAGEDPDSFIRAQGAAAMQRIVEGAEPLAEILWRIETEGQDLSTPERRAGLERRLAHLIGQIREPRIADYYRRDFDNRVFDAFKRRPARGGPFRSPRRQSTLFVASRGPTETVTAAVKSSALSKSHSGQVQARRETADPPGGIRIVRPPPPAPTPRTALESVNGASRQGLRNRGVQRIKEAEVLALILENPDLVLRHGEILAALPLADPSLDSLRHELLNLAASGYRLETGRLEDHLVGAGMAALVVRLKTPRAVGAVGQAGLAREGADRGGADAYDVEIRWLRAAAQLREITEIDPERRRALARFTAEATEESWRDAHRLLAPRALPND